MSQVETGSKRGQVNGPDLRQILEQTMSDHFDRRCTVVSLARRPAAYCTSFALEELDATLDDGTTLPLVFKNLSPDALLAAAQGVRPAFLHDPRREIETYRAILKPERVGTPICYGAVVEPAVERYWLFLERVDGPALWQLGDLAAWQAAARWLACLHARFADRTDLQQTVQNAHLLTYDAAFYRVWPQRAQAFAQRSVLTRSANPGPGLVWLAQRYEQVVERLVALPSTLIHGEFYASNILVPETAAGRRVCAVDWEMAALGPGLVDLAALTVGNWDESERLAISLAYRDELREDSSDCAETVDDFLTALDTCRLHLAVQWLGWAEGWTPPPEHAQNWLDEALRLAEKLNL